MNLLEACWQGNLSQVERLLQQGEDVNQTDVDGSTPLFLAIKQGYSAIVSKLLQYHADINLVKGFAIWPRAPMIWP